MKNSTVVDGVWMCVSITTIIKFYYKKKKYRPLSLSVHELGSNGKQQT